MGERIEIKLPLSLWTVGRLCELIGQEWPGARLVDGPPNVQRLLIELPEPGEYMVDAQADSAQGP